MDIEESVKTIPIDFNERYIVLITLPSATPPAKVEEVMGIFEAHLKQWQETQQKFLIFAYQDDISVKFERIENESSD